MAYDEELAGRIRAQLGTRDVVEKRMFGGVGMMLHGNMACGLVKHGLLVRIDPADFDELIARADTRPFEMNANRTPRGWVVVPPEAVEDDAALAEWVARGVAFVETLPPK
ncbi:TfoX/Sxy family protein [Spongisporangium articulatum]|uniref:TfoX/Sxy family protein n=1 Tax=Spongisporangium articulatum TaxID=3362603 RepID=A0ABW8ALI0_9ACTN